MTMPIQRSLEDPDTQHQIPPPTLKAFASFLHQHDRLLELCYDERPSSTEDTSSSQKALGTKPPHSEQPSEAIYGIHHSEAYFHSDAEFQRAMEPHIPTVLPRLCRQTPHSTPCAAVARQYYWRGAQERALWYDAYQEALLTHHAKQKQTLAMTAIRETGKQHQSVIELDQQLSKWVHQVRQDCMGNDGRQRAYAKKLCTLRHTEWLRRQNQKLQQQHHHSHYNQSELGHLDHVTKAAEAEDHRLLSEVLYLRAIGRRRYTDKWVGAPRVLPLSLCPRFSTTADSFHGLVQDHQHPNKREILSLLLSFCPARQFQPWRFAPRIISDVTGYWKVVQETEAKARLEALKSRDIHAFVEHVSTLQITALLEVMERTQQFMHSIGQKLRAAKPASHEEDPTTASTITTTAVTTTAAGKGQGGGYRRLREYLNDTSNELRLVHATEVAVPTTPAALKATLLPHQKDGLAFLTSLHVNQLNGILADEMGVGKTMQTLAFLLSLKEKQEVDRRSAAATSSSLTPPAHRPHLVLAPLTVLREWVEACERFVDPTFFRCGVFTDVWEEMENRSANNDSLSDVAAAASAAYDLLLLPVHSVRHRFADVSAIEWDYIIVDEAHNAVSNLTTITAQRILALPYRRRLVLTGTPLGSDLRELWSLLNFLNPHVFSEADTFDSVFQEPFRQFHCKEVCLTAEHSQLLVLRLHQILRPFMLRRTKKDLCVSLRISFHAFSCPITRVQEQLLHLLRSQRRVPRYVPRDEGSSSSSSESDDSDEESNDDEEAAAAQGGASTTISSHCTSANGTAEAAPLLPPQAAECMNLTALNATDATAHSLCNHAMMLPFFSQVLAHECKVSEVLCSDTDEPSEDGVEEEEAAEKQPKAPLALPSVASHTRPAGVATSILASSGKFIVLHLLLLRVKEAGKKLVLFTHWLDCMDLLADYLRSQGWGSRVEMLSGSTDTEERRRRTARFQRDPDCNFFVLSMKAGGCGINLQCAHLVALLDRDYTITNEDQALGRVYRIGQPHTVRAIYLSTGDMCEKRVVARAALKNRPRQAIIEDGCYLMGEQNDDRKEDGGGVQKDDEEAGLVEADEEEGTSAEQDASTLSSSAADVRPWDILPLWTHIAQRLSSSSGLDDLISSVASSFTLPLISELCGTEGWGLFHSLISSVDDLVLTDADREGDSQLPQRMTASLPPNSLETFQAAWAREDEESRHHSSSTVRLQSSSAPAHMWGRVLLLFARAIHGPPLFTSMLEMAVAQKEGASERERQRLERRRSAAARKIQLADLNPPPSFWEECAKRGIVSETVVLRRYASMLEKTRASRLAAQQAKKEGKEAEKAAAAAAAATEAPSDAALRKRRRGPSAAKGPKSKITRTKCEKETTLLIDCAA